MRSNPRYPVYIPSKGRWKKRLTVRCFEALGVPYRVVVEPQEVDQYATVIDRQKILVTPHRDEGLVVTRNWIWDHAQASGTPKFWTFDDNIRMLYRFNRNLKVPVSDGTALVVLEDFVERYTNVPVAGFHYHMFVKRKTLYPPFYVNRRVYSNMLIQTNATDPRGKLYRNEGFFNDDTDLCLRILKDGFCTILFNAFLVEKAVTMTGKGGLTPYYRGDGRWKMAEELRRKHPDVTKITRKWGRWQHQVDYRRFKRNKLRRKHDVAIPETVDNYGMVLRDKQTGRVL